MNLLVHSRRAPNTRGKRTVQTTEFLRQYCATLAGASGGAQPSQLVAPVTASFASSTQPRRTQKTTGPTKTSTAERQPAPGQTSQSFPAKESATYSGVAKRLAPKTM